MQFNISSRKVSQHVYLSRDENRVVIMAGSGSARTFRRNFRWRLAEYLRNLVWIGENDLQSLSLDESEMFCAFYERLRATFGAIPLAEAPYQRLQRLVKQKHNEPIGPPREEPTATLPTGAETIPAPDDP